MEGTDRILVESKRRRIALPMIRWPAFLLLWLLAALPGQRPHADWTHDFHAAGDPEERQAVIDALDTSALSFEQLYLALANPPAKPRPDQTGVIRRHTLGARKERFPYAILLPDDYDAARAYPLVVFLHGSVSRKKPTHMMGRNSADPEMIIGEAIQVYPSGWTEAKWWTPVQAANLERIIQHVKADFHIDPDRVSLLGVSDGATGGFYQAATHPTPYAAFISVIGYPGVLQSSRVYLDENVYPINLRALKILAFNTEKDPLYPVENMRYFVDAFRELDIDIELVADPYGGHDLNALKRAMPRIRTFVSETRRATHPDRLTWQYEAGSRQHRNAWLQVHELLPYSERDTRLDALSGMKPTRSHTGMIELARTDNTIAVQNLGVARYSLLLSPDQFDFSRPIRVIENGVEIFQATLRPSKRVLLRYAVRDFDASRLYGAELEIAN